MQSPKLPEYNDSGFSNLSGGQGSRMLNQDGSFNVRRRGQSLGQLYSPYYALVTMPGWLFAITVLVGFFLTNLVFASLYLMVGTDGLTGLQGTTPMQRFGEVFFFSTQTLTTVGYGHVSPTGVWVGIIASLESLLGLMGFAVATGIFYGRFSGPVAKIVFSEEMIIAPFHPTGTAAMLRVANTRSNPLTDLSVQVLLSWVEVENGTRETRKYYSLPLERNNINFLALSWTIVHPIDAESPLYGYTPDRLSRVDAELLVIIKGWDETAGTRITSQHSYKTGEIRWGAKFRPMFHRTANGSHTVLHLDQISEYDEVDLPVPQHVGNRVEEQPYRDPA